MADDKHDSSGKEALVFFGSALMAAAVIGGGTVLFAMAEHLGGSVSRWVPWVTAAGVVFVVGLIMGIAGAPSGKPRSQ